MKNTLRSRFNSDELELFIPLQFFIAAVGFVLGASVYGDIAIFGIVSYESAPVQLSGSAHALTSFAANGRFDDAPRRVTAKTR